MAVMSVQHRRNDRARRMTARLGNLDRLLSLVVPNRELARRKNEWIGERWPDSTDYPRNECQ